MDGEKENHRGQSPEDKRGTWAGSEERAGAATALTEEGLPKSTRPPGGFRGGAETPGNERSLTFSPLAPASPRRPGSPGGPCGETGSHSLLGEAGPHSPPTTSHFLQGWMPTAPGPPHPPTLSTVTHHRAWRPSLACGPGTALLTLQIRGDHGDEEECPHTVRLPLSSQASLPRDSPLRPGAPADHQGQVFLLGLQDPQGLSFPGRPQHQDPPETHPKKCPEGQRGGCGWGQGAQGGWG